jgi:hypothetical protein
MAAALDSIVKTLVVLLLKDNAVKLANNGGITHVAHPSLLSLIVHVFLPCVVGPSCLASLPEP